MKPRSLFPIILLSLGIFIALGHSAMAGSNILTNTLGMRFVFIPAGSFTMGSPASEPGRNWNEKQHRVTITKGFYLGETEVTQGQWSRLVSPNPSSFKRGKHYPVDSVSWDQAVQFIEFLNTHEKTNAYRLPTEAEWEYACRAGTQTAFSSGIITNQSCNLPEPALANTAWYCYNSGLQNPPRDFKPHPVKQLTPNAWGLYDMHGNVQEWVMDACKWRDRLTGKTGAVTRTYKNNIIDPLETKGKHRIIRGGGWHQTPKYQRSAFRGYYKPVAKRNSLGFRLVKMN